MTEPLESRTISVGIARPQPEVYAFLAEPANFPRWASGLGRSLEQVNGEWFAEAPEGRVKVRFTGRNAFGVVDHHVTLPEGAEIAIPLRVIPNAGGSEVMLTVFRRPGVTAEDFARDADWVTRDLNTLKTLLEG